MIFESRDVYEIVWGKNGRAGQVKDLQYNTASALFMLNKYGYTHTHTHSEYVILLFHGNNGYENHLNIAMYVHCLSCLRLSSTTIELQNCSFPITSNLNPKTSNRQTIKSSCNTTTYLCTTRCLQLSIIPDHHEACTGILKCTIKA